MNSMMKPRRRIPKINRMMPARKLTACAISSGRNTPAWLVSILLTALPISNEPTAVVCSGISGIRNRFVRATYTYDDVSGCTEYPVETCSSERRVETVRRRQPSKRRIRHGLRNHDEANCDTLIVLALTYDEYLSQ
jgi:hypothetical protein